MSEMVVTNSEILEAIKVLSGTFIQLTDELITAIERQSIQIEKLSTGNEGSDSKVMRIPEALKILDLSRSKFDRMVKAKEIMVNPVMGKIFVPRTEVERIKSMMEGVNS